MAKCVVIRDAFKEMVEYEQTIYNVTIYDDALFPKNASVPLTYGGGEGSKLITLEDVCQ